MVMLSAATASTPVSLTPTGRVDPMADIERSRPEPCLLIYGAGRERRLHLVAKGRKTATGR